MRPVHIRFMRIGFLARAAFKLMIALALLGALAEAVLMACVPDTKVVLSDTVLDPPLAVAAGAMIGAAGGVIVALLLFILAGVVGIVLPAILALVLVLLAFALAVTVLCVVGSVALAFSPFLLLGFGCVLLFRAMSRRDHVPEPVTYRTS